jgi:hypothetical protein
MNEQVGRLCGEVDGKIQALQTWMKEVEGVVESAMELKDCV